MDKERLIWTIVCCTFLIMFGFALGINLGIDICTENNKANNSDCEIDLEYCTIIEELNTKLIENYDELVKKQKLLIKLQNDYIENQSIYITHLEENNRICLRWIDYYNGVLTQEELTKEIIRRD